MALVGESRLGFLGRMHEGEQGDVVARGKGTAAEPVPLPIREAGAATASAKEPLRSLGTMPLWLSDDRGKQVWALRGIVRESKRGPEGSRFCPAPRSCS